MSTLLQKISDKKQSMISKQQTTYALEFFGKAIILLSSTDQIAWTEVGLADMGDPDFREMMKDFHAVVGNHGLRKAKVALFLPIEDIVIRRIRGDNPAQTLANDAGVTIEKICFTHGAPDATNHYDAMFAYRETLQEAAEFAAQFGFSATYFSARITTDGLAEHPKLYLTKKSKTAMPLALWASVAAVVAIGAFSAFYSASSTIQNQPPKIQITATPTRAPETQTPEQEPAKLIMASANKEPDSPIVAPAFDAHDFEMTAYGLDTQTNLRDFTTLPTAFVSQPKGTITDLKIASLPAFDVLKVKPLMLDALSASAELPTLPLLADNITTPTDTIPNLTDAAVPEDANIPRPKRRGSSLPDETVVTVEPVITPTAPETSIPPPPRRPTGLRNHAATTQAAIAQDLIQQAIKQDTVTSDSARAIGTNKRPPLKTANFASIVKRAAAKPRTTTVTTTTTKTVAVTKPTTSKKPVTDKSTRAATTFSKGALSLVGVFGTPSKRSALFRTATGGYRSVKIGQRVAGWKVVAISENSAKVTKGSRTKTMRLP